MNRITWLVLLASVAATVAQLHQPILPAMVAIQAPQYQEMSKAHAWERAQWHVQKRLADGQERIAMNVLEPARIAIQEMAKKVAVPGASSLIPRAPNTQPEFPVVSGA